MSVPEVAPVSTTSPRWRARALAAFGLVMPPLDMAMRFLTGLRDFPLAPVTGFAMIWLPLVILYLVVRAIIATRRRAFHAALAVVMMAGWGYVMFWGGALATTVGLRMRMSSIIGIAELQTWAIRLIDGRAEALREHPVVHVAPYQEGYAHLVPRPIRDMEPFHVVIFAPPRGSRYVYLEFRQPDFAYGVMVGSPSFRPPPRCEATIRWAPGVYGWSDRATW